MSIPTVPANILWAQRSSDSDPNKNIIFLTIDVPNLNPSSISLTFPTPSHLKFEGSTRPPAPVHGHSPDLNPPNVTASDIEAKKYIFDYELFGEVEEVPEKRQLSTKNLFMVLKKKKLDEEYWPRLTKDKIRVLAIKTDFSRWKDQDEQEMPYTEVEEEPQAPSGGGGAMDMGGMGGMGMGGMGGMGGGMGGMGTEELQKLMAQYKAEGGGGEYEDDSDEGDYDEEEEGAEEGAEGESEKKKGKKPAKVDDDELPALEDA